MASARTGPALCLNNQTELFARLSHLLINGGTEILKVIVDTYCKPSLSSVLQREKSKLRKLPRGVINPDMWKKLYPTPTTYGTSADLDITTLFVLIRNSSGLQPPASTKSWSKDPPIWDTSLEADLVRLKIYRNKLHGHITEASIPKDDFCKMWKEISDILIRRGGAGWKADIDKLLSTPFTTDQESYIDRLRSWFAHDVDVKRQIFNIQEQLSTHDFDMKANFQEFDRKAEEIVDKISLLNDSVNSHDSSVIALIMKLMEALSDSLISEEKFKKLEIMTERIVDEILALDEKVKGHAIEMTCLTRYVQKEFQRVERAHLAQGNNFCIPMESVKTIVEKIDALQLDRRPEGEGELTANQDDVESLEPVGSDKPTVARDSRKNHKSGMNDK